MNRMTAGSSARTLVALSLLPRLNSSPCLPLIEKCGGIEGFFRESPSALQAVCREYNLPPGLFDRTKALREADRELEQIDRHDIRICSVEDAPYPALFRPCEDTPLVFFCKGDLRIPAGTRVLAIVGTRHASVRCQQKVESVVAELAGLQNAPLTVSGLAYGIDASGHRASLKYGLRTFAVLGHGLHTIYPASHRSLARSILEAGGALVSEYPCIAPIHPGNFLRRNRLIAALSHAVLIAESAEKGGAMSTARIAFSYNREVMAFPGRPDDLYSAGCNRLIKENIAALVENAADIAGILQLPPVRKHQNTTLYELYTSEEQSASVIALLREKDELHIDELIRASALPPNELSALLLQMELEGKILALPGKKYAAR